MVFTSTCYCIRNRLVAKIKQIRYGSKNRVSVPCVLLAFLAARALADGQLVTEVEEEKAALEDVASPPPDFIRAQAYIQNPYIGLPSAGGTQQKSELFSDGTWNAYAAASYMNQQGSNNYGYGVNLFGETGQLAGFSVGGLMTIMNPLFSDSLNPQDPKGQNQTLPIAYQVTPQELFVEYQYANRVQLDAGYIGIANSPWLTYYQNNALNMVTYQGAMLNINPGGGWLFTGLALNGAQLLGENGFSQQTMYNSSFDSGSEFTNVGAHGSPGTLALGTSWNNAKNDVNLRIWAYQFYDYASMLYADTTVKVPLNHDLGLTFAAQGAVQGNGWGENQFVQNNYGTVNSNMLGAQLSLNYKIFGLQLGYNNLWGPQDAVMGGGMIAPYTYQIASDPLYTTGWMLGMVEKSAGQAYKIAPSLSLLDGNLQIIPSYQYYATTAAPISSEYDLQLSYTIPQVRGLTLFVGYGYSTRAIDIDDTSQQGQIMVSYLY